MWEEERGSKELRLNKKRKVSTGGRGRQAEKKNPQASVQEMCQSHKHHPRIYKNPYYYPHQSVTSSRELQVQGCGPQLQTGGMPLQVTEELLSCVEQFK